MKKTFTYLWLIALLITNLYAMSQLNLTSENLSYFSVLHQHVILFLWGSLSAGWFYHISKHLFHKTAFQSQLALFMLRFSTLSMLLAVILPYQPERFYFLSELHIFLSFVGTISFAGLILWYHHHLHFFYPTLFHKGFGFYVALMMFCLLQYVTYGCINTYMEVSFSAGLGLYLFFLTTMIKSSTNQDQTSNR